MFGDYTFDAIHEHEFRKKPTRIILLDGREYNMFVDFHTDPEFVRFFYDGEHHYINYHAIAEITY